MWLHGAACYRELPLDEGGCDLLPIISAARYSDVLAQVVHAFKYEATPHLSSMFAAAMVEALRYSQFTTSAGATLLVPVPMHPRRQRERGYNHSALLAHHIGQVLHLPVDERALQRVRNTEQQARLDDPEARRANVHGAFKANSRRANAGQIILIDDIFTTGATLRECALALRVTGVQDVAALTLARARD